MNLFHVVFAQAAPSSADLECTGRGSCYEPAFLTCGLKSVLQGFYPYYSFIFQRNLQNWCHFGAACLGFVMSCVAPACRLSSGPSGISPAPSAPPPAGRGATLPSSVGVPGAFFCITHKPKISKFLSSLHTSSYQVLPELMLPSFKGVCYWTCFLGGTFLLFIPDGLGTRLMFPGKGSPVYDWRMQCLNSGYQGWREPTLVWDSVTQWGQLGAWVRLRERQASLLLTPLGGKHNLKSRR